MRACVCVCVCACVFSNIFSETTGPTEAKFNVEPPWDRGRVYSNCLGHLLFFIIVNLCGAGAFSKQRFYNKFVPAVQGVYQSFKN